MNPEFWQQLKTIFQSALELEGDRRSAFLTEACAGRNELRAEVEKLLVSHEAAGSFLIAPAVVDAGALSGNGSTRMFLPEDRVGQRIGAYEIIREVGHGGMGTVFLAVRADDQYRKQVAIKLVNRGMDTDLILRRFMMERQILANLEHPNIARLLEGGSTPDGLPYFVMEFIEGEPITEYCDTRRFTTTQRLELFRQVCAALQYAHQNLVVHRDIKPGNILVTPEGVPKLLDFGIAKLLSPGWDAETGEVTASIVRLMTPEYASPEQFRETAITTASDVYSLGVVLYELLSGHQPYRLRNRRPQDVAEIVSREEPLKPSAVVTRPEQARTTGEAEGHIITPQSVGRAREGSLEKLRRRLSGDLDNIVLKAMRKEPSRRYVSAQEFSEDIRRHLEGLPVVASPDTFSYRASKFFQRHKVGSLAAAAVVIILCTATVLTTWQARVARRERDRAQNRFNQVRKLAHNILFEYDDRIEKLDGSTPVREKMVEDASEYLDALAHEAVGDRGLQIELAAAYQKLGDVQGGSSESNLGDRNAAIKSYGESLAILQSLTANQQDKSLLLETAGLHGKLYQTLWKIGQQGDAETHFRAALGIREKLVAFDPANLSYQLGLARSYRDFGNLLASKTAKDAEGAISYYRKSNDLCAAVTAIDGNNLEARAIAGLGYRMLGAEFELRKDATQAVSCYEKALALTKEREKLDANNPQIQIVLADCYSNIGRGLMLQQNESGALENFKRALAVFAGRFAKDPENSLLLMNVSQTYNNMGNLFAQSGKFQEARANYQQALSLREGYIKSHPTESGFKPRLGETTFDLGELYAQFADSSRSPARTRLAQWREARGWYQRSSDVWQQLSRDGTLPGYQREKPTETANALSRCDTAIAKLAGR